MVTTRVSTSLFFDSSISDIGRLQKQLAELSEQVSSGQKASTFSQLGSDTIRFQDIEKSTKSIDTYIGNNSIVISRLNQQDTSMSQLQEIAEDLKSALITKRSPSGSALDLRDYAQNALEQVRDALSVSVSGRFLFAGARTNTPPISESVLTTSNVIDGVVNAGYYDGDSTVLSISASESLEVEYGITAADPAFQQLIGALHTAIEAEGLADSSAGQDAILANAVNLVDEAINNLASVRNRMGNDIQALEATNATQTQIRDQLRIELTDLSGTDVVEASIRVAENEATLQAVLQTFSRISQLSLNDFL